MSIKLLKIKQVCELVGVSRAHVYKLIKTEGFPRPLALSPRSRAWREDQILKWLEDRPTGGFEIAA